MHLIEPVEPPPAQASITRGRADRKMLIAIRLNALAPAQSAATLCRLALPAKSATSAEGTAIQARKTRNEIMMQRVRQS